ncbi:MAG: hypothetical protein ACI8SR_000869 [Oceanicoccus sp.]|jgi:hypothetical protein
MKGTHLHLHLCGGLSIILAAIFYANFRNTTLLSGYLDFFHLAELNAIVLPKWIYFHFPSFLQTLFIGYVLHFTNCSSKKSFNPATGAIFFAGLLELFQLFSLLPGTFDINDLIAIFLASFFIFIITPHASSNQKPNTIKHKKLLHTGLITSSFLLSMACMEEINECNSTYSICVKPITLTWEELREDINPEYGNTAVITVPGKIHVKDKYLFIVDNYRGVHIFDQTDPQNPIRVVFIPVQGTLQISINDGLMYLNGFTDLVVIDYQAVLNGEFNQSHVWRKVDIFNAPKLSSFFPDNYNLDGEISKYSQYSNSYITQEKSKLIGFIIGYIDTDGTQVRYGEYDQSINMQDTGDML